MTIVNIHEAKTTLSKLIEQVEEGHEVVIARNGHPVARLVPMPTKRRRPGRLRGRLRMGRNFDAPLPDALLDGFTGESG